MKINHKIFIISKLIIKWLILFIIFWQMWIVGWVLWWKWVNPNTTAFMEQSDYREHQWIKYQNISYSLKQAVVSAEDDNFVEHEGFDWDGIELAIKKNIKKGKISAGGSTISQQLAKNLFLSGSRSFIRKGHEAIITLWLETLWDKKRILEVYLNVAEWGIKHKVDEFKNKVDVRIYGAEMASKHYFNISAQYLNDSQSARLAVLLPAPRRYGENIYSKYINMRTTTIMRRLDNAKVPK